MCAKCHRLEKKSLRETHITSKRAVPPTIQKCRHCSDGVGYPTVSPQDIPAEVRGLPDDALWALRPLEPDVGQPAWAKHGFRVHTDMIRFWWRPQPVTTQIGLLEDPSVKQAAKTAFEYLMRQEDSAYRKFVDMHTKFLRRNAAALQSEWDRKLLLPRHALEEEGLECAVWPHLYPRTSMCETRIRQQDIRRKERARAAHAAPPPRKAPVESSSTSESTTSSSSNKAPDTAAFEVEEGTEDDTEGESEDGGDEIEGSDEEAGPEQEAGPRSFAREGRNSAKSAYLAKVLGPVLGYGATYELFQFVYDLWLWSTLGAKEKHGGGTHAGRHAGLQFLS